jgi:hypothetical protein
VLLLPLLSGGRTPAGPAATGVALSLLVWGLATGLLVPFVHKPLHENIETASKRKEVGPDAAVGEDRPIRQRHEAGEK